MPKSSDLSHLTTQGEVQMVDISGKIPTIREAIAMARVRMLPETLAVIESGNAPKWDVLATARIAGIMAAKQTPNLIPLCHPFPLQKVTVEIRLDAQLPGYEIHATVKTK
ncbi:MAG: cyclic pyranopterin monophosphate synthase MoaC, partial [Synechococcales cyanobacterium]